MDVLFFLRNTDTRFGNMLFGISAFVLMKRSVIFFSKNDLVRFWYQVYGGLLTRLKMFTIPLL